MRSKRSDRLASSLMHVFRVTHAARDAKASTAPQTRGDGKVAVIRPDLRRETISEIVQTENVRNDIIALLNTIRLGSAQRLTETPNVARSVLNYGFPDLLNRALDDNRNDEIGDQLAQALARHEPRLVEGSVKVLRDDAALKGPTPKLSFQIKAAVKATPVELPLEFIAEIESSSGKIRVSSH